MQLNLEVFKPVVESISQSYVSDRINFEDISQFLYFRIVQYSSTFESISEVEKVKLAWTMLKQEAINFYNSDKRRHRELYQNSYDDNSDSEISVNFDLISYNETEGEFEEELHNSEPDSMFEEVELSQLFDKYKREKAEERERLFIENKTNPSEGLIEFWKSKGGSKKFETSDIPNTIIFEYLDIPYYLLDRFKNRFKKFLTLHGYSC